MDITTTAYVEKEPATPIEMQIHFFEFAPVLQNLLFECQGHDVFSSVMLSTRISSHVPM